jgi:hypothetical protein
MGKAPEPNCGIIPGSSARLYISADATEDEQDWLEVHDLDSFTLTTDSTDTSLNSQGWIRSLPMERGESLTATGRVNVHDEGQKAVDATSTGIGCAALAFYRFRIPGPHATDPDYVDQGFWAWADKQDTAAGSTDPFSWGVALRFWQPPVDLVDGQPPDGNGSSPMVDSVTPTSGTAGSSATVRGESLATVGV